MKLIATVNASVNYGDCILLLNLYNIITRSSL